MPSKEYQIAQAASGIKVGDTVIAKRVSHYGERGWNVCAMPSAAGQLLNIHLEVSAVEKEWGILVKTKGSKSGELYMPYFVLEKVEPIVKKPCIQVTRLNDDTFYLECERGKFILEKVKINGDFYARCIGLGWEQKLKLHTAQDCEEWAEMAPYCLPHFAKGYFLQVELDGSVG